MQNRKILCAAAVLMTLLTLFFAALPLYAAGSGTMNNQSGGMVGGALENAADAVKGAAEGIFGNGRTAADRNSRSGNTVTDERDNSLPAENTDSIPGSSAGTAPDNTPGNASGNASGNMSGSTGRPDTADEQPPLDTAEDGSTLGDTNGDGMTDDRAPDKADTTAQKDGFSWGGILLAILTAAAVIVVVILLIPRKSTR
ncbi:MAG: hypothetical protein IKY52_10890 [Clostridia bacterium]|nr:hypothetical protein [Clostridia bacterium]